MALTMRGGVTGRPHQRRSAGRVRPAPLDGRAVTQFAPLRRALNMAVSLSKGGNVSLSKEAPGLTDIVVGLGWDVRATDGTDFDLDGSVFLVNAEGKVRSDADFIFYNNLKSTD